MGDGRVKCERLWEPACSLKYISAAEDVVAVVTAGLCGAIGGGGDVVTFGPTIRAQTSCSKLGKRAAVRIADWWARQRQGKHTVTSPRPSSLQPHSDLRLRTDKIVGSPHD